MSFTTNRFSLRRRFLLGTTVLVLGGFLGASAASCVTLPDIPGSQCGNRVVEPDNGEACDENTERCGLPSSIGACRFLCDYENATGIQCPTGLGCGLDRICRKSGGLSASPISIAGGGIQKLMSGDFDGDRRKDIVAVGFSTADVHFLTTEGYVERTVTLPNEKGFPSIGDVNGDDRSDIVFPLDRAVSVLLGQEDRSFAPQSYTTMLVAPQTRRLIPLGAYTEDRVIFSLSESDGKTAVDVLRLTADGGHYRDANVVPDLSGLLQGAIATKSFDNGGIPCGGAVFELSKAMNTEARVVVGKRCADGTITFAEKNLGAGSSPWGGTYLADADKDGIPELFFGIDNGDASLRIAKLDSAGLLLTDDFFLDFEAGNCDPSNVRLASAPLAIGDVNGDGYADIVDSRGILLYDPNGPKKFTRLCHEYSFKDPMDMMQIPGAWTNAVIADFNGDGQDDVLASRKGQNVLDFWTWQLGGFNTITIAVSGLVGELVSGDLDGDTIADAAFRFVTPPMQPMEDGGPPAPLFAMFGNAFGLPSPPRVVGFVKDIQQLAIGQMKGKNLAGQPDLLSDLVVLSMPPVSPKPLAESAMMPLTLVQGNSTRNLLSPLGLQGKTASDVDMSDEVNAVFVSRFGTGVCQGQMGTSSTPSSAASNIITLGAKTIWLAGANCEEAGASVPIDEDINIGDRRFLFAPVDPGPMSTSNETSDSEPVPNMLAIFMHTPTYSNQTPLPPNPDFGLGHIEFDKTTSHFKPLPTMLHEVDFDMRLPSITSPDAPYAFADIDDNGRQDVILTAQKGPVRTIYIFWNGDKTTGSGTLDNTEEAMTPFPFTVPDMGNGVPDMGIGGEIVDIAAINIDDDRYKELAILTRDHIYFAKLRQKRLTKQEQEQGAPLELETLRPLELLPDEQAFTDIRGGEALLSIDANSDGIDDLIVADTGKLLLYVGTERLK